MICEKVSRFMQCIFALINFSNHYNPQLCLLLIQQRREKYGTFVKNYKKAEISSVIRQESDTQHNVFIKILSKYYAREFAMTAD